MDNKAARDVALEDQALAEVQQDRKYFKDIELFSINKETSDLIAIQFVYTDNDDIVRSVVAATTLDFLLSKMNKMTVTVAAHVLNQMNEG